MSESSAALSVSTAFLRTAAVFRPCRSVFILPNIHLHLHQQHRHHQRPGSLHFFLWSREVRALREQHRVPKPPCFECGEELKRERRKKGGGRKFVFFFFFFFSRRAQDAPGLVSEASIGVNTLQMRFMQKNPKTRFVLNSCFRCDAN